MGNCEKQNRKRPELDINELSKRIKFESKQIQKTFSEIEGLLKRSQELMKRLQITSNNRSVNGNAFFDVAEAPAAPPVVPPTPPTPQAPVTTLQQTLISNIFSTVRDIGRVRRQIRNTVEALIGGSFLLRRRLRQLRASVFGAPLVGPTLAEIELGIFVLQSQLENLRIQLVGLQEDLDINIALLANTVL